MKTREPWDRRYSIRLEWTGNVKQRWVLRFCGEWVSDHDRSTGAVAAYRAHRAQRLAAK